MIHFGTAGLRGLMEEGPDGMNEATVALAARGVAAWLWSEAKERMRSKDLKSASKGAPLVTIGYDARHSSEAFARLTARCLQKAGLEVSIFSECVPTPLLVYSIRKLGADAGICITASHNPKTYNGFKVYNREGIQIGEREAKTISKAMQSTVDDYQLLASAERFDPSAVEHFLLVSQDSRETPSVPAAVTTAYIDYVTALWPLPGDFSNIKIVYTPVHGVGGKFMEKILKQKGCCAFHPCPEQFKPDPDFPTAPAPNPENLQVLELAAKLGREVGADLVLATDPDADRAAVMLQDEAGDLVALNGNELGGLLLELLLRARAKTGHLPGKGLGVLVKSLVTDDFGATIARSHGLEVKETLTGFKNICGTIPDIRAAGQDYVFGYEESIGYAFPDAVRDKDGLAACLILAAAAGTAKAEDTTLWEIFTDLCRQHGHFVSAPWSFTAEGDYGSRTISRIVDYFRLQPPTELAGCSLERLADFQNGQVRSFSPLGEASLVGCTDKRASTAAGPDATSNEALDVNRPADPANFPRQNLLIINYNKGLDLRLRPSGTEPKLKFYIYAHDPNGAKAVERAQQALEEVQSMVDVVR